MLPYLTTTYGNPNSLHQVGKAARDALEAARTTIATALGATDPSEICFTSGGTEANNLALRGVLGALRSQHRRRVLHVITSSIEHAATFEPLAQLAEEDALIQITYLKPTAEGMITPETLKAALREETVLVTLVHGNNEIGAIQPIAELGAVCRAHRSSPIFHIDACQSFTKVPIDVRVLPLDLITVNAHKIHGPKGAGALWIRRGIKVQATQRGGGQELGLRGGTSNVPGIVGMAAAVSLALVAEEGGVASARMRSLCSRLIDGLRDKSPHFVGINGPVIGDSRLCNNVSVLFKGLEADMLLRYLSTRGVCCSTGSACSSEVDKPSHVLIAIGRSERQAKSTLRFSLSRDTTENEVDAVISVVSSYTSRT